MTGLFKEGAPEKCGLKWNQCCRSVVSITSLTLEMGQRSDKLGMVLVFESHRITKVR